MEIPANYQNDLKLTPPPTPIPDLYFAVTMHHKDNTPDWIYRKQQSEYICLIYLPYKHHDIFYNRKYDTYNPSRKTCCLFDFNSNILSTVSTHDPTMTIGVDNGTPVINVNFRKYDNTKIL